MERRTAGEVRAEGRRLSGTVLTYGEVSPTHRERFEPGSIRLAPSVHLDLFHDAERAVAWMPGGGLEVRVEAGAVTMTADLPPIPAADRALQEVRSGRTTGLSLEFRALEEHRSGSLRVITAAELAGIGLVRSPSYTGSRVEARAKSGFSLRSFIPGGRRLDCECSGGECSYAEFSDPVVKAMLDEAFEAERNLIVSFGNYTSPIASTTRGTVRRDGDSGFEIDIPDSAAGRALLEADEAAGTVVRPFLDAAESESVVKPLTTADRIKALSEISSKSANTRVYKKARMRALIVSSTDKRGGWPVPRIIPTTLGELAQDVAATAVVGGLLGIL